MQIRTLRQLSGFTLVELVLVIVLLGIVATVSTGFLGSGAQMYAEASDRDRLLSQSRFALERLTRELRIAVPNSARVSANGMCLEFIPLLAAARYEIAPTAPETADFVQLYTSLPELSNQLAAQDFISIYPTEPAHVYEENNRRVRLASVEDLSLAGSTATSGQRLKLNFNKAPLPDNNHSFPTSSPSQRLYLWRNAVSYCVEANALYRYQGYDLQSSQPVTAAQFVGANSRRVLMAEQLEFSAAQRAFRYENGVLTRTSVVHVLLSFSSNFNDQLFFNQEIHIPNVP